LDAAAAYMARMEKLYTVDLAVAVDDGNDGVGGRGGKAGAPGSDGIARVNCQAVAAVAVVAVEEEEEEGVVDRNGDRAADGDGGPVAQGDHEDGDKSAAPCTGRMTTTTAPTAIGIVPRKASWIIATTARPIATNPAVVAKLGAAVAAAAAAEVAGTAKEKNGGGGNTKAEENLHL
jgi:hypothetical protein